MALDYRKPVIARAEEMARETGWADEHDARRPRHAILWHMPQETYDRVINMEVCYQCLTAFPARPMRENMSTWKEAERAGFRHVRPTAVAHRLIREGRCPVCAAPINPEALGYNDLGDNPLNKRSDDE